MSAGARGSLGTGEPSCGPEGLSLRGLWALAGGRSQPGRGGEPGPGDTRPRPGSGVRGALRGAPGSRAERGVPGGTGGSRRAPASSGGTHGGAGRGRVRAGRGIAVRGRRGGSRRLCALEKGSCPLSRQRGGAARRDAELSPLRGSPRDSRGC